MKLTKLVLVISAAAMAVFTIQASAQESTTNKKTASWTVGGRNAQAVSKSDPTLQFRPHVFLMIEDGVNWSMRQNSFIDCLSNNFLMGAGYNFTPIFGVRGMFGFTQGRGRVSSHFYSYETFELYADAMFNFSNLISGFRHDRAIDVYPYLGIGSLIGTNPNSSTVITRDMLDCYWDPVKGFFSSHVGLFGRIRLTNHVSVVADFNWTFAPDRINSKTEGGVDNYLQGLVGVLVRFGSKTRSIYDLADLPVESKIAASEAALVLAKASASAKESEAAAEPAPVVAEPAPVASEPAPAVAEPAPVVAEAPAPAPALPVILPEPEVEDGFSKCIFFDLDCDWVNHQGYRDIMSVVKWMKENPKEKVNLVGYASKESGGDKYNLDLSRRRAEKVKYYLLQSGISASRISISFKGEREQPFSLNEKNRVVVASQQK